MTPPQQPAPQGKPNPAGPKQPGSRNSFTGVRLRKHADYQKAYAASRKRQSSSMSWFLAVRSAAKKQDAEVSGPEITGQVSGPRVGLTAGKVLGKAHERNRIKRRMRDIVRRHLDLLPPNADLILHPRRMVGTMDFAKLEAEFLRILSQAQQDAARGAGHSRPREAAGPKPGSKQAQNND